MTVAEIFNTMEYGPAPESDAFAQGWLSEHRHAFDLFIGGEWCPSNNDERLNVVAPGTGTILATTSQADDHDVNAAVTAAARAQPDWAALSGHVRSRYLYALARSIQRHARLLSVLESLNNGKPIRESRDIDIPLVARHFYHHAGWAQIVERAFPGYEPLGVVGQIIPWNFPLLMLAWKIAPALAAGNTVVLKPAEFTPLTALLFGDIVQRVGLPAGVVNIITGDGRTGERIVGHPDIQKIAFTGSTEVGRSIRRTTAGTGKRISLELGGKSPFVVFEDADLDSVVEGVVDAIWFNQGQVCCAGSRLLVQESIAPHLNARLKERMERLRVGNPLDKAIDIGAIIAPVQLRRIQRLVEQGINEGAEIWQPSWACPAEGYFYPPTLFTNVSPAATIAQVEIFGPVLVSMTFRSPEEAVALANNTRYGLAASVWSENLNVALDTARRIKAGTIWINSTNVFDASSGFGGYRESGYGREGGREGMYDYLQSAASLAASVMDTGTEGTGARVYDESAVGLDGPPMPAIDRTPKLFIGGKQVRGDSGYSRIVYDPLGHVVGEVVDGNRKDIRNAVEAARAAAEKWADTSGHGRAQILYYLAENLEVRQSELTGRISSQTGESPEVAAKQFEDCLNCLFDAAAWADKYDGAVHATPMRAVTLAMPEPIGVLAYAAPDQWPLLGLVAPIAGAIAMGNAVVAVPSQTHPLCAIDLYQVIETSDVPPGVINLVTGPRDELAQVLADHDAVDAIWYAGTNPGVRAVEMASAGNLKRTWTHVETESLDALLHPSGQEERLREATQVKNIWAPYGA